MNPSSVMIFAAGFGTRMMPLTQDRPKPMVHLAGRPMIDRAIDLATKAGATKIIANTHYKADVLEQHLKDTPVVTIREYPDILDTGGGFKNARHLLPDTPVWTMNSDAIWNGPNPLQFVSQAWDARTMDALLLCLDPPAAKGTASSGDFTLSENGQIKRGPGIIYGGIQIINPRCFDQNLPDVFSMNLMWDYLIAEERCFGVVYPGEWCDIGTPDGLQLAETMLVGSHDL